MHIITWQGLSGFRKTFSKVRDEGSAGSQC